MQIANCKIVKCRVTVPLLISVFALLSGCGSGGGSDSSVTITPPIVNNNSKGGCFTTITPVGGSNTAISGKIEYQDKEYGLTGFTNNTTNYYKAVRYAEVEIVNSATSSTIASAFTNSSGLYRIPAATYTNVTSAYLRVGSYTTGNTNSKPPVEIYDLSGNLYAVGCDSTFTPQAGTSVTTNLSIPTSNEAAGAFNLMDVFTSSGEFINSLAGANPPLLNAYWEVGNSYGTWYCSGAGDPLCPRGEGIYVLNEVNGDTDEYDDDVLWHEYGHFVAAKFSKDDSQGGIHYLDDYTLDLRLAWSEGWGDFFPAAVKTWLNSTNTALLSTAAGVSASQYVDTNNGSGWSFDIGNSIGAPYIYSSNEVAVANILWRTMNETTSKMSGIWDVFYSYIRTAASPINLETFWDGWLEKQPDSLETIFSNRSIFFKQDLCEVDDSVAAAKGIGACGGDEHYLYKTGASDVDFVSFSANAGTNYTIETYNLKNGADTYLTLYDSSMNKLSENDNANGVIYVSGFNYDYYDSFGNYIYPLNNGTLSSKLPLFTPSISGTYYIKVNTSPNIPKSAGRYGTYTLKITNQ